MLRLVASSLVAIVVCALLDACGSADAMVAAGWLAEGDGPNLVVMCAPA